MQIEKRLKNYYKRWNIQMSSEEEFLNFKNRIIKVIDEIIGDYLACNSNIDKFFIEIFKIHKADEHKVKKSQIILNELKNISHYFERPEFTASGFGDTNIYKYINNCKGSQELATVLQFVFWAMEKEHDKTQDMMAKVVEEIRKISILTPSVSFQICKKGKQVIIYPYGDPFLDNNIVNCVISGLEEYPKVAKHFEAALKIYQSGEINQYRNLLDNLRFALEQLLKNILNNDKSLENQKELLPWLDKKGLNVQVVNLYEKLLKTYQYYQNNAVKHNEAFSLDEVEFMIYLTGNFMRLILQLAKQENNVT